MKVRILRIDKQLPLPKYHSPGAAGFDFVCRESVTVPAKSIANVPCNVCIETPVGYMLLVASRGGTPMRKGLMPAHGVGIGDWDYRGDNDEYFFPVYNYTDKPVVIERGERIAQGIFIKVSQVEWDEVDELGNKNRRETK